jgi:hypothetical protein
MARPYGGIALADQYVDRAICGQAAIVSCVNRGPKTCRSFTFRLAYVATIVPCSYVALPPCISRSQFP